MFSGFGRKSILPTSPPDRKREGPFEQAHVSSFLQAAQGFLSRFVKAAGSPWGCWKKVRAISSYVMGSAAVVAQKHWYIRCYGILHRGRMFSWP